MDGSESSDMDSDSQISGVEFVSSSRLVGLGLVTSKPTQRLKLSNSQLITEQNMKVEDCVFVVTGGASGLGQAVVRLAIQLGARGVGIFDLNDDDGEGKTKPQTHMQTQEPTNHRVGLVFSFLFHPFPTHIPMDSRDGGGDRG